MMRKGTASIVSAADAEEALRREFVDLAFNRLRLDRQVTPGQVEKAMRLIDSGAMDDFINSTAPAEHVDSSEEMYADAKPFSHAEWKKRHGLDE